MNLREKSSENFCSARFLSDNNMYRASCNRYYYAMFLRLNDICIRKLNYTVPEGSHSHVNLIKFYENAIKTSVHEDKGKKSIARTIARNIYTAKDFRKDADYYEEEYIDEEICNQMKDSYEFMIANWSAVNDLFSVQKN